MTSKLISMRKKKKKVECLLKICNKNGLAWPRPTITRVTRLNSEGNATLETQNVYLWVENCWVTGEQVVVIVRVNSVGLGRSPGGLLTEQIGRLVAGPIRLGNSSTHSRRVTLQTVDQRHTVLMKRTGGRDGHKNKTWRRRSSPEPWPLLQRCFFFWSRR